MSHALARMGMRCTFWSRLTWVDGCACRAVKIAIDLKEKTGTKLKDFKAALDTEVPAEILQLRKEVESYATTFPTIGFDKKDMRYQE